MSHSIENRHETRLVIDIGGGSTELILGRQFQPLLTESLDMGCISMSENWFRDGKIRKKEMNRAIDRACQEFELVQKSFRTRGWDTAIGTSGTILAVLNATATNGEKRILNDELFQLRDKLLEYGDVNNLESVSVSRNRAPVLPGGVAILCAAFKSLGIADMQVSTGSLREGVLHDLLGRVHDEDIREKSVQDLIVRFHIDQSHAERVAAAAHSLFNLVHQKWNLDPEDDAKLLRWAALLHEIGMDISHASYHKHGAYVLGNMDIAGFSLHDQHQLASLVRSHRRKYSNIEQPPATNLLKLVLLLRLAVVLKRSRSDDEKLPPITLSAREDCLTVRIAEDWIKHHMLTKLDLEQECNFLDNASIQLRLAN